MKLYFTKHHFTKKEKTYIDWLTNDSPKTDEEVANVAYIMKINGMSKGLFTGACASAVGAAIGLTVKTVIGCLK